MNISVVSSEKDAPARKTLVDKTRNLAYDAKRTETDAYIPNYDGRELTVSEADIGEWDTLDEHGLTVAIITQSATVKLAKIRPLFGADLVVELRWSVPDEGPGEYIREGIRKISPKYIMVEHSVMQYAWPHIIEMIDKPVRG